MARYSRGVSPEAVRDLRRLLAAYPDKQAEITQSLHQLLGELVEDPHTKGTPAPRDWCPELRALQAGSLQVYFAVRSPDDRYVRVYGFSWSP
jgi:hypothetical protein